MACCRTTHRSSKGTKLYAVRNAKGQITDLQTYKRAHGADLRKTSKAEASKRKGTTMAKAKKSPARRAASKNA